jgi:hypothetical protein
MFQKQKYKITILEHFSEHKVLENPYEPLRKKKKNFFFEVSIFTYQSKALIKLIQKIVLMKSFRLIPKKKIPKNYFYTPTKRPFRKLGFWSIKIRKTHIKNGSIFIINTPK